MYGFPEMTSNPHGLDLVSCADCVKARDYTGHFRLCFPQLALVEASLPRSCRAFKGASASLPARSEARTDSLPDALFESGTAAAKTHTGGSSTRYESGLAD